MFRNGFVGVATTGRGVATATSSEAEVGGDQFREL
jgi:hypothetical protein